MKRTKIDVETSAVSAEERRRLAEEAGIDAEDGDGGAE